MTQSFPVYELLKDLCARNGISIKALEKTLDFSDGFFKKWKTHSPNISNLVIVADYFGVPLDYLIGRKADSGFLFPEEERLVDLFRSMNAQGKAYLLQTAEMASRTYIKSDSVSEEVN